MSALPLVEMPWWAVAGTNVAAWALFHGATGFAVHLLPLDRLRRDGPVLRLRRWERDGAAYRRLRIHAWKDRLPEAGDLFRGGTSKRHLAGTSGADLERFAAETRRAERGHWLAMACGPLAVLWNPPVGAVVMIAYGVVANAPFIAVQRYNRARVARVLRRLARSSGSPAA
jgi:glycosyl-4,4'-diaponeurosporenoate acyltransferase